MKRSSLSGFTLVELLIVMALLAAIALTVIAAINPLEQANRARDTRFKADSSQLLSAIERYFASKSEFPWVTNDPGAYDNDAAFGFVNAANPGVGICRDGGCSGDGVLISSLELKTEFRNRDFVKNSAVNEKTVFIGKDAGGSASVYACFIPMSKSARKDAVADGKVYTLGADGTRTQTTACDADAANWITTGCYICVPE